MNEWNIIISSKECPHRRYPIWEANGVVCCKLMNYIRCNEIGCKIKKGNLNDS